MRLLSKQKFDIFIKSFLPSLPYTYCEMYKPFLYEEKRFKPAVQQATIKSKYLLFTTSSDEPSYFFIAMNMAKNTVLERNNNLQYLDALSFIKLSSLLWVNPSDILIPQVEEFFHANNATFNIILGRSKSDISKQFTDISNMIEKKYIDFFAHYDNILSSDLNNEETKFNLLLSLPLFFKILELDPLLPRDLDFNTSLRLRVRQFPREYSSIITSIDF